MTSSSLKIHPPPVVYWGERGEQEERVVNLNCLGICF